MINTYAANGQKLRTKYYTAIFPVVGPILDLKDTIEVLNSTSDATMLSIPAKVSAKTIPDYISLKRTILRLDDYFGNILYENGTAEDAAHHPITKVLTPEGYVDYATAGKPYCYYRKDHLGSIREVDSYQGPVTVLQKTQYYPSGTPFAESFGAGEQAYKFTGKEMITMHGLNWQDFGARWLDNARLQFTSVDPLAEKHYDISPYAYCAGNPVNRFDPDGMDWYTSTDGKTTYWQKGSEEIEGYKNIGTSYTQKINDNTSITWDNDNKATSTTTNTMTSDEWVSQYSKPMWGDTPADKACNKASDAMLANEGVKSSGMEVVVNNAGNGRAGTANNKASDAIDNMSTTLDLGKPTKVNVDRKPGSSSADKMGDHFIVVEGKTETLNSGQVTSTTFNYFDPGTHYISKGTSPSNTLNIMNRTLVGTLNKQKIIVTSIRPSK